MMKLKEDILNWVAEIKQLKAKTDKTLETADNFKSDVQELKNQVSTLLDITEKMADTMLALIRQQMGD